MRDSRSTFDHELDDSPRTKFIKDSSEITSEFKARLHCSVSWGGAENDAKRIGVSGAVFVFGQSHGERRVVRLDGARTHQNRIAVSPKPVGVETSLVASDPLRRTIGSCAAAIKGRGQLQHNKGATSRPMMKVRG
jgi:hypothetical protein